MALIKCNECGKEISDKANTCPNCGCPIEKGKKKVRIIKSGGLALRCSVFIDNQPIGQIGVGSNKSIEIEIPVGTHYISTITQVKNQSTFVATNGVNTMATPITTSTSQEQDGKQFEVKTSDELTIIEILAKGSWSGSTGRYVIGDISTYDKDNIENISNIKNNGTSGKFLQNHLTLIIVVVLILFIFLSFFIHSGLIKDLIEKTILIVFIIGLIIFFITKKKK